MKTLAYIEGLGGAPPDPQHLAAAVAESVARVLPSEAMAAVGDALAQASAAAAQVADAADTLGAWAALVKAGSKAAMNAALKTMEAVEGDTGDRSRRAEDAVLRLLKSGKALDTQVWAGPPGSGAGWKAKAEATRVKPKLGKQLEDAMEANGYPEYAWTRIPQLGRDCGVRSADRMMGPWWEAPQLAAAAAANRSLWQLLPEKLLKYFTSSSKRGDAPRPCYRWLSGAGCIGLLFDCTSGRLLPGEHLGSSLAWPDSRCSYYKGRPGIASPLALRALIPALSPGQLQASLSGPGLQSAVAGYSPRVRGTLPESGPGWHRRMTKWGWMPVKGDGSSPPALDPSALLTACDLLYALAEARSRVSDKDYQVNGSIEPPSPAPQHPGKPSGPLGPKQVSAMPSSQRGGAVVLAGAALLYLMR